MGDNRKSFISLETIMQTIFLALRISLAFLLIVVGITGLLLPIMPGWIILIPGLLLLSREFVSACRESKIRVLRETACQLSESMNRGRFRRFFEKLKNWRKNRKRE